MGKNVKIPSYWEASKKFISEKDFLKQLINFDKDNIPDNVINKVRQGYISNTAVFNAKRVEKASSAAKGLCEWILALDEYDKVLKIIRPKQ
jgi:dynein heavy chain